MLYVHCIMLLWHTKGQKHVGHSARNFCGETVFSLCGDCWQLQLYLPMRTEGDGIHNRNGSKVWTFILIGRKQPDTNNILQTERISRPLHPVPCLHCPWQSDNRSSSVMLLLWTTALLMFTAYFRLSLSTISIFEYLNCSSLVYCNSCRQIVCRRSQIGETHIQEIWPEWKLSVVGMQLIIEWPGTEQFGSGTTRRFFEKWSVCTDELTVQEKEIREMLEGQNFQRIDRVFPFQCGFFNRASGYADTPLLPCVKELNTEIIDMVTGEYSFSRVNEHSLHMLQCKVREFMDFTVRLLSLCCVNSLFPLKTNLLDHQCHDLEKFGRMGLSVTLHSRISMWSLNVGPGRRLWGEAQGWGILCRWWGRLWIKCEPSMRKAGTVRVHMQYREELTAWSGMNHTYVVITVLQVGQVAEFTSVHVNSKVSYWSADLASCERWITAWHYGNIRKTCQEPYYVHHGQDNGIIKFVLHSEK